MARLPSTRALTQGQKRRGAPASLSVTRDGQLEKRPAHALVNTSCSLSRWAAVPACRKALPAAPDVPSRKRDLFRVDYPGRLARGCSWTVARTCSYGFGSDSREATEPVQTPLPSPAGIENLPPARGDAARVFPPLSNERRCAGPAAATTAEKFLCSA